MKKLITKITLIKLTILFVAILTLSSCGGARYGCPVNAQHGFGPGR